MNRWIDLGLAVTSAAITAICIHENFALPSMLGLASTMTFSYLAATGHRSRRAPRCQICDRPLTSDHALCYWCRQKF